MMVAPEKVGEMELPGSYDTHIHGPLKFSQIGSDAATKLLATALEPWDMFMGVTFSILGHATVVTPAYFPYFVV